jgi:diguanylate cyclase (GGDEF)-like protein/hemerythrin-like metal-binding protein
MFEAQLDYIYFFFGLVLFLLGSVCVSMSRSGPLPTPWWILGIFAFLHGIAEWLELYALTGGDSRASGLVRTAFVTASFLLLFEFARRTQRFFRGTTPGSWVYLPGVVALAGIALTAGTASLDSAVRLLIGAPAAFWTASLFFTAASRTEDLGGGPPSWRARVWGGIYFGAFGLVAGLVVPGAPFLPERWPSPDAFLSWTGIPIQLVRGLVVCGLALSVWSLAVAYDPKGRILRKKRVLFWAMASSLVALLGGGWLFTDRLGRLHERDLVEDAEASASQAHDHLAMGFRGAERGARSLAELLGRYHVTGSGIDASRIDGVVDALSVGSEDSIVYVLDPSGTTVATSNRGQPDSFLGKNFAARPYFREAREGRPGRFTGVGTVSGVPGYYASEPVRDASGQVIAVAVVKQNLGAGQIGPAGVESSAIIAADGRIMVAGRASHGARFLWRSAGADGAPGLLDHELVGTGWVSVGGEKHIAVRRPIEHSDWALVVLKKERTQVANRLLGIIITLLLCSVVLTYFVAMQRQLGAESHITVKRREAEGRAREAARRADTDALTGLLNRMGFNEAMSREMARARRYQQPLSVVMLDIDHFKRLNDEFGHPSGDQVLARTAALLSSCVRDSDVVARWGGEEFVVIAPTTPEAGAASLAEKLRSFMEATHLGPKEAVTASFGVTELRPDDTAETLLQRVDGALYQAKQSGRNQVCRAGAGTGGAPAPRPAPEPGKEADVPRAGVYASTGFGPIDRDHDALGAAIDAFVHEVDSGKADAARAAMERLIGGVSDHFAREEGLMAQFAYPLRRQHMEAHASFVADARRSLRELQESGVTPAFRRWAKVRLPDWIRFHILAHDTGLGRFLVKAGAGAASPADGSGR